ncbi:MAG: AAA family ATPase [Pseudomonadota bacterium]|nr:AAA family ATPase [Pseudomonadota bacterium]
MTETPQQAARRFAQPLIDKGYKATGLHAYTEADGSPIYYRMRLKKPKSGEKWIRPMHANGSGFVMAEPKFEKGKKPLYGLDRIACNPDSEIWVAEGEAKCDVLNKLGLVATTSGSATSARDVDWSPLRGRTVRVWPDNDDAGLGYAANVTEILKGMGCRVTGIDVGALGLGPTQDAVDWLATHSDASKDDVAALPVLTKQVARPAALERLEARPLVVIDVHDFIAKELPVREEILGPWMLTQSLSMVYAWRGVGKTHVALGIAYAVASGGKFLTWKAPKSRSVLYIDGEMPAPALQERLVNIAVATDGEAERGMLRLLTPDLQPSVMPDLATTEGQDAIEPMLGDAELVIVDNLSCLVRRGGRENDAESWLSVAEWALRMRARGRSVLFIHHSGKNGQQRGTSKREDLLDAVLSLKQPPDHEPAQGAVFEIHYEKARNLHGDQLAPVEARLTTDAHNHQVWVTRAVTETTLDRVVTLANEGLTQSQIVDELEMNRSTVSRALRKAKAKGLITKLKPVGATKQRADTDG